MEPSLPRTIYRRESLPTGRATSSGRSPISPVQNESRTSSGLREEDELMKFGSQSSIVSSNSPHFSSGERFSVSTRTSFNAILKEQKINQRGL
jgi:curli biogenesis system outer membrane secretion channel CsgG